MSELQRILDRNAGKLPVSATITGGGDASAANQVTQTGLLTTIDADTSSLASAVATTDVAPSGSDTGLPPMAIRDDALTTLGVTEGRWAPVRVDANGALWVQLAGALSSLVDSVSLGLPPRATARAQRQLRLTSSTGSTDLWTPAAGKKIAVKSLVVTWQGANACRITIWQGANADTTHSDTEPKLFDIDLDANANGGFAFAWPEGDPWATDTDDHELHVTLSADKTVSIVATGYEFD